MRIHWTALRVLWGAVLIAFCLGGCYTAKDLRAIAANTPDPRQEQIEKLWEAMQQIVHEEQWPKELESREDLLVATSWMMVKPQPQDHRLRRRVRFSVIVAPQGVGINVLVKYQREGKSPEDAPDQETWSDMTDPVWKVRQQQEERALVARIQQNWRDRL